MDISEVLRPAAVLPESAARLALVELAHSDVRAGGLWASGPALWERYDRPLDAGDAELIGSLSVSYGHPTRYAVALYRATVTAFGASHGWTVQSLCDEALGLGGYTLATCPRATLAPSAPVLRLTA